MSEDPGSTSLEVAVATRDPHWRDAEPRCEDLARRAATAAFGREEAGHGLVGQVEVSLVLADDALVRDLNRTYRGQDRATNVLSFTNDAELDPASVARGAAIAGPRLLGDVILARETVLREARDQGKSVGEHLTHLVVHGVLHLLGFDHEEAPEAEAMEALEVAILADLGIADPYARAPAGPQ